MNTSLNMKSLTLLAVITWSSLFAIVNASAGSNLSQTSHEVKIMVNEVAMVASTGPDNLVLDLDGDRDGTMRLQYTAVNTAGGYRSILVSWRPGSTVPSGTSMRIRVLSVPTGAGQAGPELTVTDRPSALIDRIPSCATSVGGSGALLEYRLAVDDASKVRDSEATMVTLVFTISEDL